MPAWSFCRSQAVGQGQVDLFTLKLASPEWVNTFINGSEDEDDQESDTILEDVPVTGPPRIP